MSSPQIQYTQLLLPYPQFTGVSTEPQLIGISIYHGLQLAAEKRYSNGLQFLATLRLVEVDRRLFASRRQRDLAGQLHQPAGSQQAVAGAQSVDVRHSVCAAVQLQLRSAVWARPGVAGEHATLGGCDHWRMEDEWHLAHRRRTAPEPSRWRMGIAIPTYGAMRPNIVGTPKRNHGSDWVDNYFCGHHACSQRPPDFTLGNAPRALGSVRSPWSFTTDLSLGKQFPIREEMNVEVRMEARNAFNHPVFGTPIRRSTIPGTLDRSSINPATARGRCSWR